MVSSNFFFPTSALCTDVRFENRVFEVRLKSTSSEEKATSSLFGGSGLECVLNDFVYFDKIAAEKECI